MTENLFIFFYLALRYELQGLNFLMDFLHFYLFSAVATTYGYLANDLSDRRLDAIHGKPNVFLGDSTARSIVVVIVVFILANLLSLGFCSKSAFLTLWVVWLFMSTFYSLPPLRLKEKGFWGLVAVVPAQRILPALLAISVFGRFKELDTVILVCYAAVRGLMSDLQHQIDDFDLDSGTKTNTFASRSGLQKTRTIFRYLLAWDIVLQALLYLCCCRYLPFIKVHSWSLPIALPLPILYLACLVTYWFSRGNKEEHLNPYRAEGLAHLIHVTVPCFYFPFFLIVIHSLHSAASWFLLAFFIIIHRVFLPSKIKSSVIFRALYTFTSWLRRLLNVRKGSTAPNRHSYYHGD
jgi:4-hydroxybenzoate polyprenyltransferase